MQLSKKLVTERGLLNAGIPTDTLFALPEKVLQFGTGVLLRGLPDHFIDKANKQGVFNGRIVVVKSTNNGGTDAFAEQDGLYTLLERGVEHGEAVEKTVINASISRVLSASAEWDVILECAKNPAMQLIISNTTEVGIVYHEPDVHAEQPVSFPGRLLAFLQARYTAFSGSEESGMVIVPTELIPDNGSKLKEIVLQLANARALPAAFISWLENANDFCNSLVDCIVPGKLAVAEQKKSEQDLGYKDELLIMSEPYRLWAIETNNARTAEILSFSKADNGVVISPDINKFRELKLRLLNATHTFSCGLAHLSGFATVKEAMLDEVFRSFIQRLMKDEIVPLVVSPQITNEEALNFAAQVTDRFSNPYIDHLWLNITMQYTSKMAMRTVPLLKKYYELYGHVPEIMAAGFAAFIIFMDTQTDGDGKCIGTFQGKQYTVTDEKAELLQQKWKQVGSGIAGPVLGDVAIFGSDLSAYPGFAEAVERNISLLKEKGAKEVIRSIAGKKILA